MAPRAKSVLLLSFKLILPEDDFSLEITKLTFKLRIKKKA